MRRFVGQLLWCVLMVQAICAGASAGGPKEPQAQITRVDVGWANSLPSGRWAPITVWVTSGPRAFTGELSLEYSQDATQRTMIVAPFSTTPDQTTPVELVAAVPRYCQSLTLEVTAETGRTVDRVRFVNSPEKDERPMPAITGECET